MPIPDPNTPSSPGLLRAILDAIYGSDEAMAGIPVTRLTTPLLSDELAVANVETTVRFGELHDGLNDARLIIGGEIIEATGRTNTTFTGFTRGLEGSTPKFHQIGTIVYDYSKNSSALGRVWRGIMLNFAGGRDLDVIGRNLGLARCLGLTDDQYRQIIELVAYGPRQPLDMFVQILNIVYPGAFEVVKKISMPWHVIVYLDQFNTDTDLGKFYLSIGNAGDVDGDPPHWFLSTFTTGVPFEVLTGAAFQYANPTPILGVYLDSPLARRGFVGFNYFTGGSYDLGTGIITLGTDPGPGVPVLVYGGVSRHHYLTPDSNARDLLGEDHRPYLGESGLALCLADMVRAAGIRVVLKIKRPPGGGGPPA